jgi:nucleoside-diphosphate kinase
MPLDEPSPAPLEIPRDIHDAMVAHCQREAPLECCGILAGIAPRVSSFHPLRNSAASESRYRSDGDDLIKAHREIRERGAEILAIYHSHPRWAAVPSRTDLEENYYGLVPRIIVSLLKEIPEVRIWRFEELRCEIIGSTDASELWWSRLQDVIERTKLAQRALLMTKQQKTLSPMERTLIIFKPDCVQRRLVGAILERFEAKGLRIAALKLIQVERALAEKHYAEHRGKPFFEGLISFITSTPVIVGVLEGNEAISVVRTMLGATSGAAAAPGTIRGDFSISKQNNLLHGSDGPESAQREIALWFGPEELVDYSLSGHEWVSGGV